MRKGGRFPFLEQLWRANEGLAFVEFAFAAPIFFTLVLGGIEITNLTIAHLRVSQIAMTVADNAGRVTSGIDEANVYEVFAGGELIGEALNFTENGRIVLSSLEDNRLNGSRAGQQIRWQRCWGELDVESRYGSQGDGSRDSSLANGMGADGNRIAAMKETAVMFVEVTYDYQPIVGMGFFDPPQIRYESAFNVRGRQNNALSNTQNLRTLNC